MKLLYKLLIVLILQKIVDFVYFQLLLFNMKNVYYLSSNMYFFVYIQIKNNYFDDFCHMSQIKRRYKLCVMPCRKVQIN